MDHDRPEQPVCYDAKGRCTRDTNGDEDCAICASPYWLMRRGEIRLTKPVKTSTPEDPYGETFW